MWFGSDRGIAKFDGYNFRTITTAEGLSDNTVFSLLEDTKGRIWYQPYSSRMGYLLNDTPHVYRYYSTIRSFLKGTIIDGMVVADNFDLWLWGAIYEGKSIVILHVKNNGATETILGDTTARNVYVSEDGNRCISTGPLHAKLVRIISFDTHDTLFTFPVSEKATYRGVSCCKKNGVQCVSVSNRLLLLKDHKCIKLDTVEGKTFAVSFDKDGNLLIGRGRKGVEIYKAATGYKSHDNWLPGNSVTGIACDREGGLWFTTLENGVFYLSPGFSYSYTVQNGLPQSKVISIRNVHNDVAMICVGNEVVLKSGKTGKLGPVQNQDNFITDIYHDSVSGKSYVLGYVYTDKRISTGNDVIWSYGVSHLIKFNKYKTLLLDTVLVADRIKSLFQKTDNDLLVGTVEGLYEVNENRLINLKAEHPLLNSRISDIARLDSDHIVIATIGQGLLLIQRYDFNHPLQFTISDGLPSMMCNVLFNKDSTLWIGTNKGLCKVNNILSPAKRSFHTADNQTGLISNEINDVCIIGNDLWIATMNGVSVLPLTSFPSGTKDIPLCIEQVSVNGSVVDMQSRRPFPYNQNSINISFTAISYGHAGRLQYRYRLKGIDNWHVTTSRNVIYNALRPGDYTFEVNVIGPDQKQSSATGQYSFTILKPFWATWWFITLCGIIFISATYALVYYRIKAVKKNAGIRNDLNRFRERALRSQMNPHFLYNSMNSIQNFIRKNDTKQSIDLIGKFALLMRLTFNNSGMDVTPLDKDLEALNLYAGMEDLRFPGKFSFHVHINENINSATTFIPPFLIQPFVENAILHGFSVKEGPGNIWLDIVAEQNRIKITIKDDGIGREKAMEITRRKEKYMPVTEKRDSAISVTTARIVQAWGKNAPSEVVKIIDLYDADNKPIGTLVQFYLPLIYDKSYTG